MPDFTWSASEKKAAKTAYDRAYQRECQAILVEVQSMLTTASDAQVIWRLEEYLRHRRREIDHKYDYRYSILPLVFMRLYHEGWLTDDDLVGLSEDKLRVIRTNLSR